VVNAKAIIVVYKNDSIVAALRPAGGEESTLRFVPESLLKEDLKGQFPKGEERPETTLHMIFQPFPNLRRRLPWLRMPETFFLCKRRWCLGVR